QSDPPSLLRTHRCSRPRGQPLDRASPLDLLLHVRAPNEKKGPRLSRRTRLRHLHLKGWAQMAKPLVSDELWAIVEPLIPKVERRYRFPGRRRIDDRKVLTGILFVLRTGIPWEYLPQEMGCGVGMTCCRSWKE